MYPEQLSNISQKIHVSGKKIYLSLYELAHNSGFYKYHIVHAFILH